jgi:hypothetical protein
MIIMIVVTKIIMNYKIMYMKNMNLTPYFAMMILLAAMLIAVLYLFYN